MASVLRMRAVIIGGFVLMVSVLLCVSPALATTVFYVDPDWKGTPTGSASSPWTWLDGTAWAAINAALVSDDVVVYFSARAASSDTNQTTTYAININRTDVGARRLTLDGMSQYNANDASPSWTPYSGSRRFQITTHYPISTNNSSSSSARRVNWTLRGFHAIAVDGQALYMAHFNNVVVENSEFQSSLGAKVGPGIAVGFGSNVTIRNNYVHNTAGEAIYVGGYYGLAPGVGAGDTILIEGNRIMDAGLLPGGTRFGQGDGIDVKDAWTNVTIRGNVVGMTTPNTAGCNKDYTHCGEDGIITNSAAVIENNFIFNMDRVGINLAGFYSAYDGFWRGTIIRNNVVVNSGVNPDYPWAFGIAYVSAGSPYYFIAPEIYNNTVYKINKSGWPGWGKGIYIGALPTTVSVHGNILSSIDGIDFEAASQALSSHGRNDYWRPTSGATIAKYGTTTFTATTITTFEGDSLALDPQFVNTDMPYARDNFALRATSPLCGKNIGAMPCVSGGTSGTSGTSGTTSGSTTNTLQAPTNLTIR